MVSTVLFRVVDLYTTTESGLKFNLMYIYKNVKHRNTKELTYMLNNSCYLIVTYFQSLLHIINVITTTKLIITKLMAKY